MQQSLNNIAGTSEMHYNDYKKQVFEFSTTWRNYLVPMLFKNQKFTVSNYKELPNFTYQNRIANNVWFHLLSLVIISILLLITLTNKSLKNKVLPLGN